MKLQTKLEKFLRDNIASTEYERGNYVVHARFCGKHARGYSSKGNFDAIKNMARNLMIYHSDISIQNEITYRS